MKAVERIKVKLSAFTYLDEHFDSDCLIISSPFFICAPLRPKTPGHEETFPHSVLTSILSLSQWFPLTPLPLTAAFPYPCHYHTLVVHSHLFSISLVFLLSSCFMHTGLLAHMSQNVCVWMWVLVPVFSANILSTRFYVVCCPGKDNFCCVCVWRQALLLKLLASSH